MPAPPDAEKPLRIAIATTDMRYLDAHFGAAPTFAIFDVTPDDWHFVEAIGFDDVTGATGGHSDTDDKITPKVEALEGVAILFVGAIGGPAAAKVVRAGVHPVRVSAPEPIPAVLVRVQGMLRGTPPPWLRKVLGRHRGKPAFRPEEAMS